MWKGTAECTTRPRCKPTAIGGCWIYHPKKVFNEEQKQALVSYLQKSSQRNFGLTAFECKTLSSLGLNFLDRDIPTKVLVKTGCCHFGNWTFFSLTKLTIPTFLEQQDELGWILQEFVGDHALQRLWTWIHW